MLQNKLQLLLQICQTNDKLKVVSYISDFVKYKTQPTKNSEHVDVFKDDKINVFAKNVWVRWSHKLPSLQKYACTNGVP